MSRKANSSESKLIELPSKVHLFLNLGHHLPDVGFLTLTGGFRTHIWPLLPLGWAWPFIFTVQFINIMILTISFKPTPLYTHSLITKCKEREREGWGERRRKEEREEETIKETTQKITKIAHQSWEDYISSAEKISCDV